MRSVRKRQMRSVIERDEKRDREMRSTRERDEK